MATVGTVLRVVHDSPVARGKVLRVVNAGCLFAARQHLSQPGKPSRKVPDARASSRATRSVSESYPSSASISSMVGNEPLKSSGTNFESSYSDTPMGWLELFKA